MATRTPPRPLGLGLDYARGLLMGAADVVPGVSGGTMALIVGIYERLVSSIRAAASAPVALVRGDLPRARARLAEVEWRLVLPLGAGILTALVLGSLIIPTLLEEHPERSRALFFGLIAASVPLPWRRMQTRRPMAIGLAVACGVAAFLLVGIPPQTISDPALPLVFAAAAIAICAMILPGISGSFLLLAMGMYVPTLEAVRQRQVLYIAVFAAGAAIGLGLFARLLEWLLEHRHDATMAALVGLMLGSLRALWPWQDADRGLLVPTSDGSLAVVLGLAALGFGLVTALVRLGERRDAPEPTERRPA
jgi:putative membrane protein